MRAGLPASIAWQPRAGDTVRLHLRQQGAVLDAVVLPQPPQATADAADTRVWWYLMPLGRYQTRDAGRWEPAWIVPDSLSLYEYILETPLSSN